MSTEHRRQIAEALKQEGCDAVIATFQGGNDEGYFNTVEKLNIQLDELTEILDKGENFYNLKYDVEAKSSSSDGDHLLASKAGTWEVDHILGKELMKGISRWGSFAGEYSVEGMVVITPKTTDIFYDETTYQYESSHETLD